MNARIVSGEDVFESGADLIDVTSLHRPDTAWVYMDPSGHEHRWYMNGRPATQYDPTGSFDVPTMVWVKDGTSYYEDGEPYDIGHHECRQCGAQVTPRNTADTHTQYIPGLRWFRINGESVNQDEFLRRLPQRSASHPDTT